MDKNQFEGSAKEFGGRMQGAFGDAVGSEQNSAEGRMREAEGSAQRLYGEGRDALRDVADEASRRASGLYDNAGTYAREGSEIVQRQLRDNPLSAVLVAGFVGFVLGLAARGRH